MQVKNFSSGGSGAPVTVVYWGCQNQQKRNVPCSSLKAEHQCHTENTPLQVQHLNPHINGGLISTFTHQK